jgi:hypothetical protein
MGRMSNPVRQLILTTVTNKPGIKATELVVEVMMLLSESGSTLPERGSGEGIVNTLNDLVSEQEVVEVEYVLPTMTYRVKSLYFPKGTKVKLVT